MKYENVLRCLASFSNHKQHKVSCIIVKSGNVVGTGYNIVRTSPKSDHIFRQVHAEFRALSEAGENAKGSIAYIFRQHKNGSLAIAKPCGSCEDLLKENGVKKVIYSFDGIFNTEKI